MSFNEKTGQMDWKDELIWMLISIGSGMLLSSIYIYFQRFPHANYFVLVLICCASFYILGILIRIQNHRGKILTGRTAFDEAKLKFTYPVLGFIAGIALLLF